MIDQMGINVSKDIYQAVRKATSHLVKATLNDDSTNPQGGTANASAGLPGMNEEMKTVLNSKADKNDIENLTQLKANKVDTELSFKWIDLVHKQLK